MVLTLTCSTMNALITHAISQNCIRAIHIQPEIRRMRLSPRSKLCPGAGTTPMSISIAGYMVTVNVTQKRASPTRVACERTNTLLGTPLLQRRFVRCTTHIVTTHEADRCMLVYPTLLNDKNTIPYLVILWKEAPCPTSTQIKLWAKQLKVQESDIRAWMELELDNQRQVLLHLRDTFIILSIVVRARTGWLPRNYPRRQAPVLRNLRAQSPQRRRRTPCYRRLHHWMRSPCLEPR